MSDLRQDQKYPHLLQMFDSADPLLVAYTYKKPSGTPALLYGGRFGWTTGSDTIPVFGLVADSDDNPTYGPVGQWICWPGVGGMGNRTQAQWGQVFAAKITATSPLKATPMADHSSAATDLAAIEVSTLDGSTPQTGTFGLVVAGSFLGAQDPIFFAGGVGQSVYKVISGSGPYVLQLYDYPGHTAIGGTTSGCKELSGSTGVPAGLYVFGQKLPDGNIWFSAPYGC